MKSALIKYTPIVVLLLPLLLLTRACDCAPSGDPAGGASHRACEAPPLPRI